MMKRGSTMSLLIKGMEMPVGCWWRNSLGLYRECPFFDRDHYCYKLNREVSDNYAKRPFDCPFIEVPTPHGRLIDADELLMDANKLRYGEGWLITVENIEAAPTVIEAEE